MITCDFKELIIVERQHKLEIFTPSSADVQCCGTLVRSMRSYLLWDHIKKLVRDINETHSWKQRIYGLWRSFALKNLSLHGKDSPPPPTSHFTSHLAIGKVVSNLMWRLVSRAKSHQTQREILYFCMVVPINILNCFTLDKLMMNF